MMESESTTTGSVLFTDLVGFTEFNDVRGDQAAVEVLDWQTRLAETIVDPRPGSRIVKELGDGVMFWFPNPCDGLSGAAALRTASTEARHEGFPLAMRMGLHYGSAMSRGDDLVGMTVNVAARLAALAGPGELLVSEDLLGVCADALEPGFVLEPVGPVSVKGVNDPVWLRRLT